MYVESVDVVEFDGLGSFPNEESNICGEGVAWQHPHTLFYIFSLGIARREIVSHRSKYGITYNMTREVSSILQTSHNLAD